MSLDLLEFENLFLFRKPQSLPLHNQGLILLRGDNRISQAASGNGVGKTSLISALSVAWFGISLPTPLAPSGRRNEDVANRFTSGPGWARVDMQDDQGSWNIRRQVRPKDLKINGFRDVIGDEDDKVLQEKITARLGFGPRTMRNAMIFGQAAFDRFAQAEQADQMRMLDEIHAIDLRPTLDRAKRWRDGLQGQASLGQQAINDARTQLEQAAEHLQKLQAVRDQFDIEKAARIATIDAQVQETETALAAALKRQETAKSNAKTAASWRRAWAELEPHRTAATSIAATLAQAKTGHATTAKMHDEAVRHVEDLIAKKHCPTCLQSTSAAETKIRAAFRPKMATLSQAAEKMAALVTQLEKQLKDAQKQETAFATKLPDQLTAESLARAETQADTEIRHAKVEIDRIQDAIAKNKKNREAETRQRWAGQAALDTAGKEHKNLTVGLSDLETRQERLQRTLEVADYWVEAFGDRGLRSLLLDESAGFLNQRLTHHLAILAAGEAESQFSAVRALKGGGSRDRITLTTSWTWGGSGLGSGSNGQDRRIDLALFAALQDLAEVKVARPFPLRVFDEPFDALDIRGKELAASWVRQEASTRGTVILITHSEEMEALVEADAVWTIILDGDGARVEIT